jgi:hypothetical protein
MSGEERITLRVHSDPDHLAWRGRLAAVEGVRPRSHISAGLQVVPEAGWEKLCSILSDYEVAWLEVRGEGYLAILRKVDHVVWLKSWGEDLWIDIFATSLQAQDVLEDIRRRLDPWRQRNRHPRGVWVQFSNQNHSTVSRRTAFLQCPTWEEIRGNYPTAVRGAVERVLDLSEPWTRGKLLIWHGPPGTGKTFALRALMMRWRAHFRFTVVTDPENLAASPEYYYEIVGNDREYAEEEDEGSFEGRKQRRHLFILEDSADLVLQESRSSHFDKVGKLLNMTDGLVGQGRQDVFVLTFNEEVSRIDPAFLRPGRCLAQVEFQPFSPTEAAEWLRARQAKLDSIPLKPTLAELYARLRGEEDLASAPPKSEICGFASVRPSR